MGEMWVQCLFVAPKRGVACKFAQTEWGTESAHKGWTGIRLQGLMQLGRFQSQQLRYSYMFSFLCTKLFILQGKWLFDFTATFWGKGWVHTGVRTSSRLFCSAVLFAMTWNLQEHGKLWDSPHEDSDFPIMYDKKNKPKKMTFRQNEDVEDTFRTCPEEKNYNVPESMVQKWWINPPHIYIFVFFLNG